MKLLFTRQFLAVVFFLVTIHCTAQSLTIKSVSLLPSDNSALENLVIDNNGDTCALLKIKAENLEGMEFPNPNQYVKASYANGIYLVYVPSIGRKLDYRHNDFLSGTIDMQEFGYKRLKSGKTYLISFQVPRVNELKSSIIMKVEPLEANVIFDGIRQQDNTSGTYEFRVDQGVYTYRVEMNNFDSQSGMVNVGHADVKTVVVKLKPIMHKCQIKGNVNNARVFVDNIDYGKAGALWLPQGQHTIRIQADGYNDSNFEVNIKSAMEIPFSIVQNSVVTHVHATPVTIYAPNATEVYKDNKRIKGWTNGQTVMFMPGTYQLSDNVGNKQKIKVGNEPMSVELSKVDTPTPNQNNATNSRQMEKRDSQTNSSVRDSRNNYSARSYGDRSFSSQQNRGYNTKPAHSGSTYSPPNSRSSSRYESTPSHNSYTNSSRSNNTPNVNRSMRSSSGSISPNGSSSFGAGRQKGSSNRSLGGHR